MNREVEIRAFIDADSRFVQPPTVRNETTIKLFNKLVSADDRALLPSLAPAQAIERMLSDIVVKTTRLADDLSIIDENIVDVALARTAKDEAQSSANAAARKQVLHDEYQNDPAQAAANKTIADQLNSTDTGYAMNIPVTYLSRQQVIIAIGGATFAGLSPDEVSQFDIVTTEGLNPQDAEVIAAIRGITGIDISHTATRKGSIAEFNGWGKVKAGHVGMARAR